MLTIESTADGALSKVDQVIFQVREKLGSHPWTLTYEKEDDGSRSLLLTIEPTQQEPVKNDE